jgi:hypothetical protein
MRCEPHGALRELLAQCTRRARRDHECEPVRGLVRRQVAPAHEVRVEPRPRRLLVRKVGHDAGRTALLDREPVHRRQRAIGQNDLPAHVLALVGRGVGPGANVDELGGHVGVLAVVGEPHCLLGEVRQDPLRGRQLLEPSLARIPAEVALEVRIAGLAVGGQVLDRRVGQSARRQLADQPLGRGAEARRALHPVVAAERADRTKHVRAVDVLLDRRRHGIGPERDPSSLGRGARREHQANDAYRASHAAQLTCLAATASSWCGRDRITVTWTRSRLRRIGACGAAMLTPRVRDLSGIRTKRPPAGHSGQPAL